MTGGPIPYQQFGFENLLSFVNFLGVFNVQDLGYDSMVTVLNDEKTKHLLDLISKQRVSKKV